jgi:hypothetical protein
MEDSEAILKIGDILRKYTGSIMLFPQQFGTPKDIISNGSCGLFESDKERFIVTNYHVVNEYLRIKNTNPKAIMLLSGLDSGNGSESINISQWKIIDSNEKLDLATIQIPYDFLLSNYGRETFKPKYWPSKRPNIDDIVCFVGYPGELRYFTEEEMTISPFPSVLNVTSISEQNIYIVDESNERKIYVFLKELKEEDLKTLGGLSGSPIFTQRDGEFEVIGVFYESFGDGAKSAMIGVHFDFIKEDGTIDRGRIPLF